MWNTQLVCVGIAYCNKYGKLGTSQIWRIQFWIFVPFVWLTNQSSYYLFSTLSLSTIQIWFDFIVHHVWMLMLWVIYVIYPYTMATDKETEFEFFKNISSIVHICSLFFMIIIVSCIVRSRTKVSKHSTLC